MDEEWSKSKPNIILKKEIFTAQYLLNI